VSGLSGLLGGVPALVSPAPVGAPTGESEGAPAFAGALAEAMVAPASDAAAPASSDVRPSSEAAPVDIVEGGAETLPVPRPIQADALRSGVSRRTIGALPSEKDAVPTTPGAAPGADDIAPGKTEVVPRTIHVAPGKFGLPSPEGVTALVPAGIDVDPAASEVVAPQAVAAPPPGGARAHRVQVEAPRVAEPAESSAPHRADVADVAEPTGGREPEAPRAAEPVRRGWGDEDAYETATVVRDPVAGAVQLLFATLAAAGTKPEPTPAPAPEAAAPRPQLLSRPRAAGRATDGSPGIDGESGLFEDADGAEGAADELLDADMPVAVAAEDAPARVEVEGERPALRAAPAAATHADRLAELAGREERVKVVLAPRTPERPARPAPPADAAMSAAEPAASERELVRGLEPAAPATPEAVVGATPSGRSDPALAAHGSGVVSQGDGAAPVRAPALEPPQAPRGFDQVTVQLGEELGGGSLRVAVRNGVVRARIVSGDERVARSLEHGLGELQTTLAKQGFSDTRVSVQGTPATRSVEGAAALWAPAAPGQAAESGAQGDTRQERHDGQARREGEDAPRHERQGRQERHERHERQQRTRNERRAWLDGND